MTAPRILTARRDEVGECPVWDGAAQALYWVDIQGRQMHRLDWSDGVQHSWTAPERIGCIALGTEGRARLWPAMPFAAKARDVTPAALSIDNMSLRGGVDPVNNAESEALPELAHVRH